MSKPRPASEQCSASSSERVTCPYCGAEATYLATSESIYHGRDFGPLYVCFPCEAWVGCHRGTAVPLGRLANAELRLAKRRAHDAFDATWRAHHADCVRSDPAFPIGRARARAYKLLARLLGLSGKDCHIGMFDVAACRRVVALCESGALAPHRLSEAPVT